MSPLSRSMVLPALVVIALSVGLLSPSAAEAAPKTLSGSIGGIELCPQFLCGTANFVGSFAGSVGATSDIGSWAVSIQHDPLPSAGGTAAVSSGDWTLTTSASGTLVGRVTGGTLTNNGDGTFTVRLTLKVRGGYGTVDFSGVLNHNVFPPTIVGTLG